MRETVAVALLVVLLSGALVPLVQSSPGLVPHASGEGAAGVLSDLAAGAPPAQPKVPAPAAVPAAPAAPTQPGASPAPTTQVDSFTIERNSAPAVTSSGRSTVPGGNSSRPEGASPNQLPVYPELKADYTFYPGNGTLAAGNPHTTPAGFSPLYSVYDPGTGLLYVTFGVRTIGVVQPGTLGAVRTLRAPGPVGAEYYDAANGLLLLESYGALLGVNPVNGTVAFNVSVPTASAGSDGSLVFDPVQSSVWVTGTYEANISVVSLESLSVVATEPIPSSFVGTLGGVFDPADGDVYFANYEQDNIDVYDGATDAPLPTIALTDYCCFAYGITYVATTGLLYVTEGLLESDEELVAVSPTSESVVGTVGLGGFPSGMAYDPATGDLYVADDYASRVDVVALSNLTVVAQYPFAQDPAFLAGQIEPLALPAWGLLFLPTDYGSVLAALSLSSGKTVARVNYYAPTTGALWDPACGCLVTGNDGTGVVFFVNETSFSVVERIELGAAVLADAYDPVTQEVWLVLDRFFTSGPSIEVLNGANGTPVASFKDGQFPQGVAVDPVSDLVFVSNLVNDTVTVFNGTSLTVVGAVRAGGLPEGVAYVPLDGRIYVADAYPRSIDVLNGSTGALVANLSVPGGGELGYDPVSGDLLILGGARTFLLDPANESIVAQIPLEYGTGYAIDPVSGNIFVFFEEPSIVVVAPDGAELGAIPAGLSTYDGAWVPSLGLWAEDVDEQSIIEIDATPRSFLSNVQLAGSPVVDLLGSPVELTTKSQGGAVPLSYAYSGLPAGCTTENHSELNCTAADPGSYTVKVTVSDDSGATVSAATSFLVLASEELTVRETGLPVGTSWDVTVWGVGSNRTTGSEVTFQLAQGPIGYGFRTDNAAYLPAPADGNATVGDLPLEVTAAFASAYPVSVSEVGLWPGLRWSFGVNAALVTGRTSTLQTTLPNGTYLVGVEPESGFSGGATAELTVSGGPAAVTVRFAPFIFGVTFAETGLPSPHAPWTVWFGGNTYLVNGSSLGFQLRNGSRVYTVHGPAGYDVSGVSPTGKVTVKGANVTVSITFVAGPTFSANLLEQGLPNGRYWCVEFPVPVEQCSNAPNITLRNLTPGTYGFQVLPLQSFYFVGPLAGHVTITSRSESETIHFDVGRQKLIFAESGLARHTVWSVSVVDTATNTTYTENGSGGRIVFHLPLGAYSYTLLPVAGFDPVSAATGTIPSVPARIAVEFRAHTFSVTFEESGLPSGQAWAVSIGGHPYTSTGADITVSVANGTHPFRVHPVAGYVATASPRPVTVSGSSVVVLVTFTPKHRGSSPMIGIDAVSPGPGVALRREVAPG